MAPPRSKKRKPSFRRLLKTSNVKLDNKLKNRQFKKESNDKKHRKEQKKLRAAIKDAVLKTPLPLERYKKRPEDEEEEEFVESLPLDMMDEDDLEQIKAMAQKASFLTRDLSSSGPVHAKKRKGEQQGPETYEKMPRKMQPTEEKELIHLLPIKDKIRGLIPQSMEKPVVAKKAEEEEGGAPTGLEQFENEDEAVPGPALNPQEQLKLRTQKLTIRKLRIASLGSDILSDPTTNIKKLKELRAMLMETDPYVAVTVRKLVMVSLMEVFKDIVPSYRIRPLTETEKASKVKRETQQLREFEEGLVSQYKFYLENLEQTVKDWKQKKRKRSEAVSLQSYKGLAEVAIRCICELLVALPHFNFHNNIIVTVVPLMNDPVKRVSDMCCEAVKKLLKQDKQGQASLGTVKVISGLVKSRNYDVRPELLKVLICLRIKEVEVKKDTDDTAPKKKFMNYKDKRKNLSRMQRKWKKAEEKLEKELLEAEASESKDKKLKLHTETLNIVFLIYFRILKKAQKSILLPAVLEGLAKFAHLINLEFFDDLLNVLQHLIQSGDLTYRESLHCIQTAFNILSGQGDVLNIDPLKFYSHLYKTLLKLNAGASNDDISIVLRCLDVMLTKRRKQVTLQRALAFVKRLSTLSLHTLPNATVGILASNRTLMHTFPKCDILLDNEAQGSGVFLPELDEPEYCNPQNTALWELHTLKRHYHPVVRRFATHLCAGAPSEGSGALIVQLARRHPVELFEDYRAKDMTFNPPVAAPTTKKKDYFTIGPTLLDDTLKQQIDRVLSVEEEDPISLDFSAVLPQTNST
ncbi:nucleolar complex protein 3 homolog [Salvelinus alpinus]|uniref:nucleolar complex protein 3 homolog n=1 Tax=Salvelinus alpinus TaxID=8036 RepID=UPI0039FCD592